MTDKPDIAPRRTGRTARMLTTAIEHAKEYGYAYVVAADRKHKELILHELSKTAATVEPYRGAAIFRPGGEVRVLVNDEYFNMQTGRALGAGPTVGVFADHYAIERWMGWAYRELHRYDK